MKSKEVIGKLEYRDVIRAIAIGLLCWLAVTVHNRDRDTAVSIERLTGTLNTIDGRHERTQQDVGSALIRIGQHSAQIGKLDTRVSRLEIKTDMLSPNFSSLLLPNFSSMIGEVITIDDDEIYNPDDDIIKPSDLETVFPIVGRNEDDTSGSG